MEFEETNKLDSSAPLVIRKQNEPQRLHEIAAMKLTPTQSDEEENLEYRYDDSEEDDADDEDDDENLKLALELSQQSQTSSDKLISPTFPSVAPTPSQPEPSLFPYGVLEPEPPVDGASTKISFRLPFTPNVSTSTIRRFLLTSSVEQLYAYIHSILPTDQKSKKFDLLTPFPRESLSSKVSQSISEVGLAGSQVIMKWE